MIEKPQDIFLKQKTIEFKSGEAHLNEKGDIEMITYMGGMTPNLFALVKACDVPSFVQWIKEIFQ